jgi:hypothetical protein
VVQRKWVTEIPGEPFSLIEWKQTAEDEGHFYLQDGWYKAAPDLGRYWANPLSAEEKKAIEGAQKFMGKKTLGQNVSLAEFEKSVKFTGKFSEYNPRKVQFHRKFLDYVYDCYRFGACERTPIGIGVRAYWEALTRGLEFLESDKEKLKQLAKVIKQPENMKEVRDIKVSPGWSVIFRGTSATQGEKILSNKTMGGEVSAGHDRIAPSEDDAKAQTGLNIKKTLHGRTEEWSVRQGGLTGFSTGGVMLVALVPTTSVRIAKSKLGEQGALGYANQPLAHVGIFNMGPRSMKTQEDQQLEAAKRQFNKMMGVPDEPEPLID